MPITLLEARLALIPKRPSYQPTGTHPSPRSASVWRLIISSGSLSSTGTPTHCSHWSLMGNIVPPHWVVTSGSRWLVHGLPCSPTAIRKDSMQWETALVIPKQESASRLTSRITVVPVTPELVLAREVYLILPCGNEATHLPGNGNKYIKATGYILVQWQETHDQSNFPNFKPRSHHEEENVVS